MKSFAPYLIAAVLAVASSLALAQGAADYPAKTVRIVVPFAPGGTNDILARLLAARFEKKWGQTFYVDNRPGGGTLVGNDIVVRSAPDGYTLMQTSSNVFFEPIVNPDATYKVDRDLTTISFYAGGGYVIVVSNNIPVTSLRELVAYSKANPGKLNQAQAGGISPDMELFKYRVGMGAVESIVYRGGPLCVQAIVTGDANFYGASPQDVMQLAKDGRLKIISYTERVRSPLLPDVPTIAESGLGADDFDARFIFALMGPAGMPADIVSKLNAEVLELVKSPEFLQRTQSLGIRIYPLSVAESRQTILNLSRTFEDLKARGIKLR